MNRFKKENLEDYITVMQGNAMKLPFDDNSFDIVINEAMLTMLPQISKEKAISEYFRVLKPGWKLLTHDVGFLDENLNEILEKLRETINVKVETLQIKVWEKLFKKWEF